MLSSIGYPKEISNGIQILLQIEKYFHPLLLFHYVLVIETINDH